MHQQKLLTSQLYQPCFKCTLSTSTFFIGENRLRRLCLHFHQRASADVNNVLKDSQIIFDYPFFLHRKIRKLLLLMCHKYQFVFLIIFFHTDSITVIQYPVFYTGCPLQPPQRTGCRAIFLAFRLDRHTGRAAIRQQLLLVRCG